MRRIPSRMIAVASWLLIAVLAFWVPFRPLHLGSQESASIDLEPVWGLKVGMLERRPVNQGPPIPDAFQGAIYVEQMHMRIRPPDPEFTRYSLQASAWEASLGPVIREQHALYDYAQFPCIRGAQTQPYAIGTWREIRIPYWVVLILSLAVPVLQGVHAVRGKQRRDRLTGNLCLACGYDLRATPDRCPECGLEVPPARPLAMPAPSP